MPEIDEVLASLHFIDVLLRRHLQQPQFPPSSSSTPKCHDLSLSFPLLHLRPESGRGNAKKIGNPWTGRILTVTVTKKGEEKEKRDGQCLIAEGSSSSGRVEKVKVYALRRRGKSSPSSSPPSPKNATIVPVQLQLDDKKALPSYPPIRLLLPFASTMKYAFNPAAKKKFYAVSGEVTVIISTY